MMNGNVPNKKTCFKKTIKIQNKIHFCQAQTSQAKPELNKTSVEGNLNERQSQWKMTSMEDSLNGRRPQ